MTDLIDCVVLWVDGSDPQWQQERNSFQPANFDNGSTINRYRDWGLMQYWFRGIEQFAPWFHRIFFVTNGQVPKWLNLDHPKLRLVRHQDYIPQQYLPTFNSNVIELWLHCIPELGEQFVLFNDDMFLTAPVKPQDFFRNGIPCESALMDIVTASVPEDCMPYALINNFALINKHFKKKEVLRNNAAKFFTLKYGKDLIRNLLLSPFQYFSCFRDTHLPSSYQKNTFERIWKEERDLLEKCSCNRFRCQSDLTHWLMKSWQICEGNFVPRSTHWGRHYELWEDRVEVICRDLEQKKYHVVCLNDSKTDIEFNRIRNKLMKSFEYLLPVRSKFELDGENGKRSV